jgi:hypothetical protein
MNSIATFDAGDLVYAVITVFISVVVILAIRRFGNLPIALFGVDLNLLTYGYLWDTATKALRGTSYWPRWNGTLLQMNKPTVLLLICLLNLFLLAWNMKILDNIERYTEAKIHLGYTNWVLRPVAIAFGLTSLVAFIFFNSMWGWDMVLIFVLVGSFVTAVGIGYLGIATDQGIKAVAESKVGAKFGSWLFLLPVFDFVDHFLSEIAPEIIRRIVSVVGVVLLLGAILAGIWLLGAALLVIGAFLLRHFYWVAFILVAVFAVGYLARRL